MFNESSIASESAAAESFATLVVSRAPRTGGRLTDVLARKYMVRVIAHAKRLARRLPAHVSLGDLISAGMLGVVEGFSRYEADRVETLDAYLDHCIRGALLDELRRNDPLTRAQRGFARQVTRATRAAHATGAAACDESLAAALGLSVEALRERASQVAAATAIRSTGEGVCPDDLLDESFAPDAALDARQQSAVLARAATTLTEREQEMLALYYEEGQTLREIGARLGVSESRVSQLHSRAIERLRTALAA